MTAKLIAIAGSQGCGKSTIVANLPYPHVPRKSSRSIIAQMGVTLDEINTNLNLTLNFQDEIIKLKLHDDLEIAAHNNIAVTERTFTDSFVYALLSIGLHSSQSDWINQYYDRCLDHNKIYDHVFYIKAGHFEVKNDGVRNPNQHYSTMVDMTMLHFTQKMVDPDKLTIIDTPELSKRLQIIDNTIKQL